MLVILRIDLLVAKTVSFEYRELVETVWSKWYQVMLVNVELISQVSLTVSPSKMFEGFTVKFVWSGKTESNILHYCHFSSHLNGVFHLTGVPGASCQLQGTTSDKAMAFRPQYILLISFSAYSFSIFLSWNIFFWYLSQLKIPEGFMQRVRNINIITTTF